MANILKYKGLLKSEEIKIKNYLENRQYETQNFKMLRNGP